MNNKLIRLLKEGKITIGEILKNPLKVVGFTEEELNKYVNELFERTQKTEKEIEQTISEAWKKKLDDDSKYVMFINALNSMDLEKVRRLEDDPYISDIKDRFFILSIIKKMVETNFISVFKDLIKKWNLSDEEKKEIIDYAKRVRGKEGALKVEKILE
jgi:polyhydroxyalkanoate synthesis regulator phasin